MEKNNVHMVGTTSDVLKEPHVEENNEEGAYLQMLVNNYDEENIGQALTKIETNDEVLLAMGNVDEYMPIESKIKGDYIFMDWVDKFITEMEDQGCTRIACIGRGLFDIHSLKGKSHDIPLWVVYYSIEEVDDHIPYGSANKSPYSSIDWVDRD